MAAAKVRAEGMTLVEVSSLIFVVAIGIVVLYPAQQQVAHVKEQQRCATQCWENVKALGNEIETWGKTHKGQYPTSLSQLKLKTLPACPAQTDPQKPNPYTAKDAYLVRNLGQTAGRFTIRCMGNFHVEVNVPKNQPQFDSLYGMQPTSLDFTRK